MQRLHLAALPPHSKDGSDTPNLRVRILKVSLARSAADALDGVCGNLPLARLELQA